MHKGEILNLIKNKCMYLEINQFKKKHQITPTILVMFLKRSQFNVKVMDKNGDQFQTITCIWVIIFFFFSKELKKIKKTFQSHSHIFLSNWT